MFVRLIINFAGIRHFLEAAVASSAVVAAADVAVAAAAAALKLAAFGRQHWLQKREPLG